MRISCSPVKGYPFFQQSAYHEVVLRKYVFDNVIPETVTFREWMIRGQCWAIPGHGRDRVILSAERGKTNGGAILVAPPSTRSEGGRAKPHRDRDLVVRGEETFPPGRAPPAASQSRSGMAARSNTSRSISRCRCSSASWKSADFLGSSNGALAAAVAT